MKIYLCMLSIVIIFLVYESIQYIRARNRLERTKSEYYAIKECLEKKKDNHLT